RRAAGAGRVFCRRGERGGLATPLTALTINGATFLNSVFGGPVAIPANGAIGSSFGLVNVTAPADLAFHFEGRDASGATWSRDAAQHMIGPPGMRPFAGITLASSLSSVALNPGAAPACQWSHQLVVRETGGYLTQLTALRQNSTDLSANLQQLFGTTRLAPFGSLSATICTPSGTQGNRTYTISGSAETGLTVSATATVNFTAASSSPAPVTVTPASVTL